MRVAPVDPKDSGISTFQNVGNPSPKDTARHTSRSATNNIAVWMSQTSRELSLLWGRKWILDYIRKSVTCLDDQNLGSGCCEWSV
jgi:hypothetical protein